ncbi:hypothetical protein ACHAQH_008714 [Verticillium albo-atrum]
MDSRQQTTRFDSRKIFETMKQDPTLKGFFHVGLDGVIRSMSGDYTVLDARGLSAAELAGYVAMFPMTPEEKEKFRDVDGSNVTDHAELYHPAPGILRKKPTEEEHAEMRRIVDAERKEREDSGQGSSCCRMPDADGLSIEDRRAKVRREIEERNVQLEECNPTMSCCKQR